ncbi:MAG: C-GCAxxG-C-C family protein [Spirochaetales bacterium]|nr:C-GCAxxG-C-C family protein [Spirochaetales bacterium]
MNRVDTALTMFSEGSACSQAVATVFSQDLGMDEATVHRLTTAFGGGMGSRLHTCGALSAGVFVLSGLHGSEQSNQQEQKLEAKAEAGALIDDFQNQFHKINCRDILGVELTNPEALAAAKAEGRFQESCAPCVRFVVEYLENHIKKG